MNPTAFYKCLADETRLKSLLLIAQVSEACVCDLMQALQLDQPKTSRHLAELRKCGIVHAERRGQWMYYALVPELPAWCLSVITLTAAENLSYFQPALSRLTAAQNRSQCP